MPQSKRRSYEARFKLSVVDFAQQSSNRAAGRKFGVNEKLVRDWIKDANKLRKLPKTTRAVRGAKCQWPDLEGELSQWVDENRRSGFVVS